MFHVLTHTKLGLTAEHPNPKHAAYQHLAYAQRCGSRPTLVVHPNDHYVVEAAGMATMAFVPLGAMAGLML